MKVKDIVTLFEDIAPLKYTEDFDNTGLLVGDPDDEIRGILVTLDTLESVVEEAISEECNLIVSFHPIVFAGLKKITGKSYVERVVQKAIKNDIAIFAIHTALDNSRDGVNAMICEKLGLKDRSILIPKKEGIKKLITFVPTAHSGSVREALFTAGAGEIGNYSNCSFSTEGQGSFNGNEESNPKVGQKGVTHFEKEVQIGVTFQTHLEATVLKALFSSHPYEEVAYEVTTLENLNQHIGMGMIGSFEEEISENDFLKLLKTTFRTGCIRHSELLNKSIKKVAVLGGSGSFAIEAALAAGADAFVSADLKYHDFFKAESTILLTDIGHYESEQFTKDLLVAVLNKKIVNFAPALKEGKVVLSQINTNPISYF